LGHAPRSGPEVKNNRSGAEDGATERLGRTSRRLNVMVRSPPLSERRTEMARQVLRGARPSGRSQSSGIILNW